MAQNSKIEWTHHTANLWHGCTKVHDGCDNCYAEKLSKRWGNDLWGNDKPRKIVNSFWSDLSKMQKNAQKHGEIHRVFVGSMMDIFEKSMPLIDNKGVDCPEKTEDLRLELFNRIDSGEFNNLLFLFLTKRPSNINKYIPYSWLENPPKNVMFGCSPVDQKTADKLIPQLLEVNGLKFLSVEPMIGPILFSQSWIDKARYFDLKNGTIDWIIVGGESGPKKRPFNPDWARSVRDQCAAAAVPFFMKQMDKIAEIPEDLNIRQFPENNAIAII